MTTSSASRRTSRLEAPNASTSTQQPHTAAAIATLGRNQTALAKPQQHAEHQSAPAAASASYGTLTTPATSQQDPAGPPAAERQDAASATAERQEAFTTTAEDQGPVSATQQGHISGTAAASDTHSALVPTPPHMPREGSVRRPAPRAMLSASAGGAEPSTLPSEPAVAATAGASALEAQQPVAGPAAASPAAAGDIPYFCDFDEMARMLEAEEGSDAGSYYSR